MNTTEKITHCQICARDIKANTGLIAHHGYQRPGMGWQTSSCDGAKQLPYEVSRDYIPVVIERYKMHAANQDAMADEMLRTPPATITIYARSSYDTDTTYEKPADFDPYATVNGEGKYAFYGTYEYVFKRKYNEHRKTVKEIGHAVEQLQKRFDEWPGVVA